MDLTTRAANFVSNPRTRQFLSDRRNQQLLGEAALDLPGMWRDRSMLLQGKNLKFAANHNHLIRLADNNRALIAHLAETTGNPTLEKAANWPTLIHLAAENPQTTRFLANLT
ncbi:MAG: hypothetical protein KF760_00135 [Candidatus Eremiobacteraeota bacterium]|nr:hypothetical protein [Candidatus Eremiobacteraeota bacterium]MCW5866629.1 hypothetical protein [Candidatus Eremiobacteraeota bacterium]